MNACIGLFNCIASEAKPFENMTSNIIIDLEKRIDEKLDRFTSNIAIFVADSLTHPE